MVGLKLPPTMNDNIVTMPLDEICSDFAQEGLINLNLSPDCCILIALFIHTHISYSDSHVAIWLYGYIAIIWK